MRNSRRGRLRAPTILLASLGLLVSACAGEGSDNGASAAQPSAAASPRIPDCPATPDLDTPPERVLTLDRTSAAFLIELGLEDRIIGTATGGASIEYPEEIQAKLDAIPVIVEGDPPKEVVIKAEPDLVVGISVLQIDGQDGSATAADLRNNGIAALVACGIGSDTVTDVSATFDFIERISEVFGVVSAGETVAARYRSRIEDAAPDGDPVSVLLLSGAPDGGAGIRTSGGFAFANGIVTLAGGQNIAEDQRARFASMSAEQVAVDDPQLIIAMSGFNADSDEELTRSIAASPLLQSVSAVRKGNIVVVPSEQLMTPHPLNGEAVATIAAAIEATR